MLLLYFLVMSIILLLLIFRIYIKKLSSFWSIQPVFHAYNIFNWIRPSGIIDRRLPEFNKFCNIINVQTKDISILTNLQEQKYVNFIKSHYLNNDEVKYLPTHNEIFTFFTGFNQPCFISTYETPSFLLPQKNNNPCQVINHNKLVGLMTSRPLIVTLLGANYTTTFPVYYVDYLCVDTSERKSGIAPQIIQTHVYNERRMNNVIQISLFKRETDLTNIIPLTEYQTYKLSLNNIPYEKMPLASIKLIKITKQTINLLLEFIFNQKEKFKCVIVPELGNIVTLLESNNLFIYGLLENHKLCSCYIFKNSMVSYKDGKSIDFIGSITNVCFLEIFYIGFCNSVHKICKQLNTTQIIYEMISDNNLIYNKYFSFMHNKLVSPTAYYFYNYRFRPIESNNVFVIC